MADGIMQEMEVYASDGVHLGTVDAVEHTRIRLNTVASSVAVESGHDRYVLLDDVARVEGNRVHMALAGTEAVHPRDVRTSATASRHELQPPADLKSR